MTDTPKPEERCLHIYGDKFCPKCGHTIPPVHGEPTHTLTPVCDRHSVLNCSICEPAQPQWKHKFRCVQCNKPLGWVRPSDPDWDGSCPAPMIGEPAQPAPLSEKAAFEKRLLASSKDEELRLLYAEVERLRAESDEWRELLASVIKRSSAGPLDKEVERLRAAIETLVVDEVISASRARELHGMTPEEQRTLWREQDALEENNE